MMHDWLTRWSSDWIFTQHGSDVALAMMREADGRLFENQVDWYRGNVYLLERARRDKLEE